MLVVRFGNGKSLKDYLIRAKLPKIENSRGYKPREKNFQSLRFYKYYHDFYKSRMPKAKFRYRFSKTYYPTSLNEKE